MPTFLKSKLLLPTLVLAALLAFPVAAQATLAYQKFSFDGGFGGFYPRGVVVAGDDGSPLRTLKKATNPQVSPDGLSVAVLHEGAKNAQELQVALAAGGSPRTLMANLREASYVTWSPDSKTLAALRGPELGKRKLVLIDVATGLQSVVASGYFVGFSFSPDGTEIAYAVASNEKYPPRSDVFRFPVPIPGVVNVRAPEPVRLTSDHRSLLPLWGPQKIVFVKMLGKNRRYGPKNELFLMDAQGKQVKRLTHTKVPALLQGLFPTDWSADGNRLLAEFEGQDTSYAVVVNPKTGAQRPLLKAEESGFVGSALSADGSTVLGYEGGFDPGNRHNVATVPYGGGKLTVLAKNAAEPSWSW